MYLGERMRSMRSSTEGEMDWKTLGDIAKFCLRDAKGVCKDIQEMIYELDYLLDIRDQVLRQRSLVATEETSKELSRDEVSRCYYIWKVDFLETRLWDNQSISGRNSGLVDGLAKRNHSLDAWCRSMLDIFVWGWPSSR